MYNLITFFSLSVFFIDASKFWSIDWIIYKLMSTQAHELTDKQMKLLWKMHDCVSINKFLDNKTNTAWACFCDCVIHWSISRQTMNQFLLKSNRSIDSNNTYDAYTQMLTDCYDLFRLFIQSNSEAMQLISNRLAQKSRRSSQMCVKKGITIEQRWKILQSENLLKLSMYSCILCVFWFVSRSVEIQSNPFLSRGCFCFVNSERKQKD